MFVRVVSHSTTRDERHAVHVRELLRQVAHVLLHAPHAVEFKKLPIFVDEHGLLAQVVHASACQAPDEQEPFVRMQDDSLLQLLVKLVDLFEGRVFDVVSIFRFVNLISIQCVQKSLAVFSSLVRKILVERDCFAFFDCHDTIKLVSCEAIEYGGVGRTKEQSVSLLIFSFVEE